jgi:hypothetical protein
MSRRSSASSTIQIQGSSESHCATAVDFDTAYRLRTGRAYATESNSRSTRDNVGVTGKEISVTPLRQRMLEELQRRNYSSETIRGYIFAEMTGKPGRRISSCSIALNQG